MFVIGQENTTLCAITLLVGGAFALALGWMRCRKARVRPVQTLAATLLLPLFVAFFSHLGYCLVDAENTLYCYSLAYFFAFWEKGYMVYGGIAGAVIALLLVGRKDSPKLLDLYAPSGAFMIFVARIAEAFLGQGYGEYATEGSSLQFFPFMMYDSYYEEWSWALFVAEALVALALFVILLTRNQRGSGDGVLLWLGLYASAQIVLESLRRDEFLRWGFVRVEELLSAVVVLVVLICYCVRAERGKGRIKALCFGVYGLMIAACLLLEFATEGRIPFLMFLDVNACYLAMAAACVFLCGCVLWMRRIGMPRNSTLTKERAV